MNIKKRYDHVLETLRNPWNAALERLHLRYVTPKQSIKTPNAPPPPLLKTGGVALGMERHRKRERYYCVGSDTHTLCIGATRSGKSRSVVLPTIGLLGLAGESMICSDPKGELFQYTYPFLKEQGYRVLALDFKNPLKSDRWNFLQEVIDLVAAGRRDEAEAAVVSVTEALVGKSQGERIWSEGEKSVISMAIMSVVFDNDSVCPDYQNLTNVHRFIAEMCRTPTDPSQPLPLTQYFADLPSTHPARGLAAINELSPERTRGSFYAAALSTLRLFTNSQIYSMTSHSDFSAREIAEGKVALFIVLPDAEPAYYSLASLFVSQLYQMLVKIADERGGRLQQRVNFVLDEFGNFSTIPDFPNKLTVGGGRGIRFNLFVQSLSQLDEKYGKENAKTIQSNCENWLFLQADDNETLDAVSRKLGNYTVATLSQSMSKSSKGGNNSSSTNLSSRALLTPDEIRRISRPYMLVVSRTYPAMMRMPDLSEQSFNRMYGLGDQEHNRKVRHEREQRRPQRPAPKPGDMKLWGIWERYREPGHGGASHKSVITPTGYLPNREEIDDDDFDE